MPFSFGKSQKSPGEIVRNLKDNIAHMERLDAADKKCDKVSDCPGVVFDNWPHAQHWLMLLILNAP